jgi:hypothetical protein
VLLHAPPLMGAVVSVNLTSCGLLSQRGPGLLNGKHPVLMHVLRRDAHTELQVPVPPGHVLLQILSQTAQN